MFDNYLPGSIMNFFRKLLSLLGSPFHGSPAVLQFRKLSPNAIEPTRASEQSAGFDLYRLVLHWWCNSWNNYGLTHVSQISSAADHVVPSKGKALIPTDLQIAVPPNCYGRVAPRSGLAHKHFIDVGGKLIDSAQTYDS